MRSFRIGAAFALLAAACSPALAADPRLEQEVDEMLLRLIDLGVLDPQRPDKPIVLEREARMRYELGAVVARPRNGRADSLEVVAVTPGGQGEAIGLKVGDQIVAINGMALANSADPGREMARALFRSRGRLEIDLQRGERRLHLEGHAEAIRVPGYRLVIDRPPRPTPAPPRND